MKSLLLLLLLILTKICTAQQSQTADVFPLKIGNEWNYKYFYNVFPATHSGTTDAGIVDFTITGNIPLKDSTRWQFIQRRNYTHTVILNGQIENSYSVQDSNNFEIIEFNYGNHELYTPVYDPLSAFPFQKLVNDTASRFFRYMVVDSSGNSEFTLNFPMSGSF